MRSLRVVAVLLIAMSCACSARQNARMKSNWAAAYSKRCSTYIAANPGAAGYGETYCGCVSEKYLATFSGIQLSLIDLSKPLRDAARAIRRQCSLVASTQGDYNQFLTSVNARSDLAITAYLTPDFTATDVRNRRENTERWLARLNARPAGDDEIAIVRSVEATLKRKTVHLQLSYETDKPVRGTTESIETRSFLTDTWVDGDGTPLLARSNTTKIETYIDGKLVSRVNLPKTLR
jgi:hypothetical protein